MGKKSSIALIVPCYNEAESIPAFGEELNDFVRRFESLRPGVSLSVIVVDNNSSDNSLELLRLLQKQLGCLSLEKCAQKGYGAALKHGFSVATADYLCFLDLDNTYPLISLVDLLNVLEADGLDIVYGARIHRESDISVIRSLGNRFYVVLLKFLFNSKLSDVCSGMRLFKSSLKQEIIGLKTDGLSFSIDFTAHALLNGWKISERPIHYRNRTGVSKLSVIFDGLNFLSVVVSNYLKSKSKNV